MDYSRSGCTDSIGGVSGGGNASSDSRYDAISKNDWKCHKCGCDNFRRRIRCFRCGISKEDSEKIKPKTAEESRSRHEINTPTSTVVVRGLDGLTSESVLKRTLENVAQCRIRNVFVARNETTGIGRGYGYMEFYSKQDAEDLVEAIRSMNSPLEIDGKGIAVDYSRESYASVFAALGQLKTSPSPNFGSNYDDDECSKRTELYSYEEQGDDWDDSISASSTEYSRRDQPGTQDQATDVSVPSSASDKINRNTSVTLNTSSSSLDNEFSNYAAPDLNRYVFDDLTGYYIDPMTGLYYDAGTQYFYHMETSNFLYWDPDRRGYVVVPAKDDDVSDDVRDTELQVSAPSNSDATSKQEEEKQKRAKEAQKIAKDMERWAKEQNSHKDAGFKKPLAPIGLPPKPKQSAAADAGFSVLAKSKFTIELSKQKEEKKVKPSSALPGLVAYGGDSDSEPEDGDESEEERVVQEAERAVEEKLIDRDKLTCLLCRRAFSSADILQKHQQLSDLHKKNLEDYKKKLTGTVTRATTTGITRKR